ncbi:BAH_G0013600.mRNA.1.CDS.1 [Saccharomyces cerevisiae]|nr:SX2_G0000170.mRNA.1.CDS.1 [Saccharomyces cerevisiae]CAI4423163.1 BAH_G0013600.mRNA.1.CDS.1 [Saccharomyces cerevisiae]CAI4424836.1 BAG_1a_G0013720.mRNA.1.CDS.1 [Saccharomyces cerevisiae]CAI7100866.1 BAH_G0013600.mRNA.1.CDS.1 [Saccharomyces cerevisiae]CAI7101139.1 BAG_1a_G0013720.mRNA.1.CDS.1 [Saccharomyces cerevisiae]
MSGIYTLLQRIFVHNGVCCEAVCFLTWLLACLCVMVTFVRSEPHKMACRQSLQLKIKHI